MTAFAEYLLKVMICSGILTGYYWLALRNKLFHSWNRFYLLAAVVISLVLPFVKISFITEPQPENLPAYTVLQSVTTNDVWFPQQLTAAPERFTKEQISFWLYLLVSTILFITLLVTLIRIKKLITIYEHWKMKDLTFVDTDAKGTPFSFLRYIFWNRQIDFESAEGQQIFKHELIHVKEKHSVDKLFLQLVLIVFWINPFFWIIRKELSMIHEFIADRKSVKDSDASAFAAMVLRTAFPGHTLSLTNPFFYSPIKRRLLMLSKLQNPKVGYISRLLLLPLLTVSFTAFALKIKEKDVPSNIPRLAKSLTVVIDAGHGFKNGVRHGAVGQNGISEDEIVLAITKKIKQLNTDKNLKLVFTRTDENFIENKERVKIAEANNADLFISLHASYAPPVYENGKPVENKANGFELYVSKEGSPYLAESKKLGSAIIAEMQSLITIRQPGIKQRQQGIWVVEATPCPSVLLECGFISNSNDAAFLNNEKNQEKIAEAVLKGIVNYANGKHNVPVTEPKSNGVIDTIPSQHKRVNTLIADSIVADNNIYADQLVIVNGKKADKKTFEASIITAKTVTIIQKNNTEAIAKYGPEAKNGLIIFEDAVITEKNTKEQPQQTKDTLPKSQLPLMVFTKTEIPPTFPGGRNKWSNYIIQQLEKNRNELKKEDISGTCEVQFIVDKYGVVSNIEALTMKNTKLATFFMNEIAKGPKWVPAIQNGRNVTSWHREKIIVNYQSTNGSDEYWISVVTN